MGPKLELNYIPLIFPEDGFPSYSFINFGDEDGIAIQIEQQNGWRTFLPNGLGYVFQQERAIMSGHDQWVAERIIELNALRRAYQQS